jgi:hypothetical protein
MNGNGQISGSNLRLTDGNTGETTSVWLNTPVNVQAFTQVLNFQLTNPSADGFTFAIQNNTPGTIGPGGGGLGYGPAVPNGQGGIANSVAVKFDLYNNEGEGINSTGLYLNGTSPTTPAIDMTGSGVNLHSGDPFNVRMVYDGATLSMTVTDLTTKAAFATAWSINIPATMNSNSAYIGFTAATGGATATQDIQSWIFLPQ